MDVKWGTCGDNGAWCGFLTMNLDGDGFQEREGVYIVWQKQGPIIRVGKGRIKDKILEDRQNGDILRYPNLLVTWASIPSENRSAIHKFLTTRLEPLVVPRERELTDALPVQINLPWPYGTSN